jgi:hypothetical protein
MNVIWFRGSNLVYYDAYHFGGKILADPHSVDQQIKQDLIDSQLNLESVAGKKLVVSFIGEGHCPQIIDNLLAHLTLWPIVDMLVVFNVCTDVSSLPYRAIAYNDFMINHAGWLDHIKSVDPLLQVDHKFLCLMRRPSPSRARLAHKLLTSVHSLKLSFGSMFGSGTESVMLNDYISMIPGYKLPILLDGVVQRGPDCREHNQTNTIFRNCLFNVVVETGSQTDPGAWRSQFVTEKTFKAFGLRQIPIWMAVPSLVSHVKAMGFDLFEDIIDHSYDNIIDEDQRQQKVVEQIIQLDQLYSLDKCQQLRTQLEQRLDNNYQLLVSRGIDSQRKFELIIQEYEQE